MSTVTEFRDYENGVADVLAFLADDSAAVERNARLPGRRSHRTRQVDVLVRGRIFATADATMIVDCKRRKAPVDVKAIESFVGMIDDVGADIGMLVTSSGTTAAAETRARAERGVRLAVLRLEELVQWSPPGTMTVTYGLAAERVADAERVLREAGFRVRPDGSFEARDGEKLISVFRHYGQRNPSAEVQRQHLDDAEEALSRIGILPRHVGHGITMNGGTPGHRWLEVAASGVPTGVKILAATEAEAEEQLDHIAEMFARLGIPRAALSLVKLDGWPVTQMFGL